MNEPKIKTQEVLQVLAVGAIVISTAFIPSIPIAAAALIKEWKKYNTKDIGRIIKRLEKQEMISIHQEGDLIRLDISDKGKRRLLEYDFENIQLKTKKRDGKWRLVIFDIPEEKKNTRDVFRRKLLQLGLEHLQDSIFVSAFPCKDEIDFLCNFMEISDYVTLVCVDHIERGEQLIFKPFGYSYN
jgi:phenylacetic acid degradation operon negative regulatory protein